MSQLLKSFGIDGKILIWQAVNFGVLFAVLWLVFYKPVRKIMAERERKISESLKEAESLRKKSAEMEKEFKSKMTAERQELEEIHKRALAEQERLKKEMKNQASLEAERIIAEAKKLAAEERQTVVSALEKDIRVLSVAVASRILEKEIDEKSQKKLIDEALKELREIYS